MKRRWICIALLIVLISSCASETYYDPLDEYVERDAVTVMGVPGVDLVGTPEVEYAAVSRGKYLVELLGCGSCHTDGALVGTPNPDRSLAGSNIGIAYTNPLHSDRPGVIFPSNITPDIETVIGRLSERQIGNSIRAGRSQHGGRLNVVMPWQGYQQITDEDVDSIVRYLQHIEPVDNRVPKKVEPGQNTKERFVYFGVYERR